MKAKRTFILTDLSTLRELYNLRYWSTHDVEKVQDIADRLRHDTALASESDDWRKIDDTTEDGPKFHKTGSSRTHGPELGILSGDEEISSGIFRRGGAGRGGK